MALLEDLTQGSSSSRALHHSSDCFRREKWEEGSGSIDNAGHDSSLAWLFLLIQLKILQRIRKGAEEERESGDSGIPGL